MSGACAMRLPSVPRFGTAAGRCGTLRVTWPLARALKRVKGLTAATDCASRTATAERYMLSRQSPMQQHKFVALRFEELSRPDDLKCRREKIRKRRIPARSRYIWWKSLQTVPWQVEPRWVGTTVKAFATPVLPWQQRAIWKPSRDNCSS